MYQSSRSAVVTSRRFAAPSSGPLVESVARAAARRLVYAAVFAPAAGEVDLRSAPGDGQAAVVPSSATGKLPSAAFDTSLAELSRPRTVSSTLIAPSHYITSSTVLLAPCPDPRGDSVAQSGILRRRPSAEFVGTQADGATRAKKKVRLESPLCRPAVGATGKCPIASASTVGGNGTETTALQEITVEVQPPSSGTLSHADQTGLVEMSSDRSLGAVQRCLAPVSDASVNVVQQFS